MYILRFLAGRESVKSYLPTAVYASIYAIAHHLNKSSQTINNTFVWNGQPVESKTKTKTLPRKNLCQNLCLFQTVNKCN